MLNGLLLFNILKFGIHTDIHLIYFTVDLILIFDEILNRSLKLIEAIIESEELIEVER